MIIASAPLRKSTSDFLFGSAAYACSPVRRDFFKLCDSITITSNNFYRDIHPSESLNSYWYWNAVFSQETDSFQNLKLVEADLPIEKQFQSQVVRFYLYNVANAIGTHTFTIRYKLHNGTWQEFTSPPVRFE